MGIRRPAGQQDHGLRSRDMLTTGHISARFGPDHRPVWAKAGPLEPGILADMDARRIGRVEVGASKQEAEPCLTKRTFTAPAACRPRGCSSLSPSSSHLLCCWQFSGPARARQIQCRPRQSRTPLPNRHQHLPPRRCQANKTQKPTVPAASGRRPTASAFFAAKSLTGACPC